MVGQTYRITAVGLAAASLEAVRDQSTGCNLPAVYEKYIIAVRWASDYETTRRASNCVEHFAKLAQELEIRRDWRRRQFRQRGDRP